MDREAIEKKPKNLDGSKSCRDAIEKAESTGIFLDGLRIYRRSIEKGERQA